MKRNRARFRPAPAVLALLIGFAGVQGGAPLTDEDVVRMFVGGTSEEELIRRIESAEVDFDLGPEMLDELRIAGLPEPVIGAMIRRQAQAEAPPDEAAPDAPAGAPRLIVELNAGWLANADKPALIRTLDDVGERLAERLELRRSDLPIEGLAIALLCRTADHVPDHWRSASPLGRDFKNSERHRVLLYLSEIESRPAGKLRNTVSKLVKAPGERETLPGLRLLTLEVPRRLTVELEPGAAHDLTLGVAVRVGGRDYLVVADHLDGVVVENEESTTIHADLRTTNKNVLEARVEFARERRVSAAD